MDTSNHPLTQRLLTDDQVKAVRLFFFDIPASLQTYKTAGFQSLLREHDNPRPLDVLTGHRWHQ